MKDPRRHRPLCLMVLAWGALLSAWVVRGFFVHAPGEIHNTHEGHSYVYRLIEFRETLAAGYLSPQWSTHFRAGLGSPYFSYYQPGFFYVGSMTWFLDPVQSLGVALWLYSMVGYLGFVALLERMFDTISGWLAGSIFLLSVYTCTELYVRGDLSEYAGMMLLPPILHHLTAWLETANLRNLGFSIPLAAALVITHPCVALLGFSVFSLVSLAYTVATQRWWNGLFAFAALFLGGAMAAFYWMPIALELDLVQGERAFSGYYHYSKHFIHPLWLIESYSRAANIPFTVGLLMTLLLPLNVVWLLTVWKTLSVEQRRCVRVLLAIAFFSEVLMTSVSKPLWEICIPLQRLQFPWRFLTLFTVSLVGLCGLTLLGTKTRLRLFAGVCIVGWAWWSSIDYTQRSAAHKFKPVSSAEEIIDAEYYYADRAHECMPKGARVRFADGRPQAPTASPGIAISEFERRIGRLACDVQATRPGYVTLPHYFFPGWEAQLSDRNMVLRADENGLMQVSLSPHDAGRLDVSFNSTPARKLGWIVTASSALVALVCIVILNRKQRPKFSRNRARRTTSE